MPKSKQYVWCLFCHDEWYTMDGTTWVMLESLHRTRASAVALRAKLNKRRKKRGGRFTVRYTIEAIGVID